MPHWNRIGGSGVERLTLNADREALVPKYSECDDKDDVTELLFMYLLSQENGLILPRTLPALETRDTVLGVRSYCESLEDVACDFSSRDSSAGLRSRDIGVKDGVDVTVGVVSLELISVTGAKFFIYLVLIKFRICLDIRPISVCSMLTFFSFKALICIL